MQEISFMIILVLLLYTMIAVADQISIQCGLYSPLFAATFTGLLLGDLQTGLIIGATLQLMTLGVATYGGATVPDYLSGAIMGTAYAIISGEGAEYGIAVAIPIGLLLTQMDVLGRMSNSFFQHYGDRCAERGDWKGMERANPLGAVTSDPGCPGSDLRRGGGNQYQRADPRMVYDRSADGRSDPPCHGYGDPHEVSAAEKVLSLFYNRFCTAGLRRFHVYGYGSCPAGTGSCCPSLQQRKGQGRGCRVRRCDDV